MKKLDHVFYHLHNHCIHTFNKLCISICLKSIKSLNIFAIYFQDFTSEQRFSGRIQAILIFESNQYA